MNEKAEQKFTLRTAADGEIQPACLEVFCIRRHGSKRKTLTFEQVDITTEMPGAIKFDKDPSTDPSSGYLHYEVYPSPEFLEKFGTHFEEGIRGEVRVNIDGWTDDEALLEKFVIYLESDLQVSWDDELERVEDEKWIIDTNPTDRLIVDARVLIHDKWDKKISSVEVDWYIDNEDGTVQQRGTATSDQDGIAGFRFKAPIVDFSPEAKASELVKFYHKHQPDEVELGETRVSPLLSDPDDRGKPVGELEIFFKPKLQITLAKNGIRTTNEHLEIEYPDDVLIYGRQLELNARLFGFIASKRPESLREESPEAERDELKLVPPSNLARKLKAESTIKNAELLYNGINPWTELQPDEEGKYILSIGPPEKSTRGIEQLEIEYQLESEIETSVSKLLAEITRTSQTHDCFAKLQGDVESKLKKLIEDLSQKTHKDYDVRQITNSIWCAAEVIRNLPTGVEEMGIALPLFEKAYNRVVSLTFAFIIDLFSPDLIDEAARTIMKGNVSSLKTITKEQVKNVQKGLLKNIKSAKLVKEALESMAAGIDDIPKALEAAAEYRKHLKKLTDKIDDLKKLSAYSDDTIDDFGEFVSKTKSNIESAARSSLDELGEESSRLQKLQRKLENEISQGKARDVNKARLEINELRKSVQNIKNKQSAISDNVAKAKEELANLGRQADEPRHLLQKDRLDQAKRSLRTKEHRLKEREAFLEQRLEKLKKAKKAVETGDIDELNKASAAYIEDGFQGPFHADFEIDIGESARDLERLLDVVPTPDADGSWTRLEAIFEQITGPMVHLPGRAGSASVVANLDKVADKLVKWRLLFIKDRELITDRIPAFLSELKNLKLTEETARRLVQRIDKSAVGKGVGYSFTETELKKLRDISVREPAPPSGGNNSLLYDAFSAAYGAAASVGRSVAKGFGWLFTEIYPVLPYVTLGMSSLLVKIVSNIFQFISMLARIGMGVLDDVHEAANNLDPRHDYFQERLGEVGGLSRDFFDHYRLLAPMEDFWNALLKEPRDIYAYFTGSKNPEQKYKGNYAGILNDLSGKAEMALGNLGTKAIELAFDPETKPIDSHLATRIVDDPQNNHLKPLKELKDTFELGEGKGPYANENNLQIFERIWDRDLFDYSKKKFNVFGMDFLLDYGGFLIETFFRTIAVIGIVFTAQGGLFVTAGGLLAAEITGLLRNGIQAILAMIGTHVQVFGWQNEIMFAQMNTFEELLIGNKADKYSRRTVDTAYFKKIEASLVAIDQASDFR